MAELREGPAWSWIERSVWDMGADPFDPVGLHGRKAWVGFSMSPSGGHNSIVVAVPLDGLIYLICYSSIFSGWGGPFLRRQPEECRFVKWRQDGWLELQDRDEIDEGQFVERMKVIRDVFDVQEVLFDVFTPVDVFDALSGGDFDRMVSFSHGYASMSSAMKRFEQSVARKRLRHNGNPVLAWAVGNVHLDEDAAENIKPNKARSKGRIDPALAAIMAVCRATIASAKSE